MKKVVFPKVLFVKMESDDSGSWPNAARNVEEIVEDDPTQFGVYVLDSTQTARKVVVADQKPRKSL